MIFATVPGTVGWDGVLWVEATWTPAPPDLAEAPATEPAPAPPAASATGALPSTAAARLGRIRDTRKFILFRRLRG
jgi:hypothetical protein